MSDSRLSLDLLALVSLTLALSTASGCQHNRSSSRAASPEAIQEPAQPSSAGAGRGQAAGAEELRSVRTGRVEELLVGRFAGVQVFRHADGISVRIRGISSLTGSNEPLYVIDGMPIDAGPGGALLGINPLDIQRIEVLKDIGSIAFYGVRGANGVVLITTRRP